MEALPALVPRSSIGGRGHMSLIKNNTPESKHIHSSPLELKQCRPWGCQSQSEPHVLKPKRRVTFLSRIRIKEIQHRNETPADVLEAAWLTTQEYTAIRDVLKKTIRLMMEGRVVDNDPGIVGLSSRGLEKRTREGQANRNHRRSCCRKAVLNEQSHQLQSGVCDLERLARISSVQSARCVMDAQVKAFKDAHEARMYLS
jgi:hypothetical protein